MKKAFVASVVSIRRPELGHRAMWCIATSEQEAVGIILQRAKELYPASEGWESPDVSAVQLPVEFVKACYDAIFDEQ